MTNNLNTSWFVSLSLLINQSPWWEVGGSEIAPTGCELFPEPPPEGEMDLLSTLLLKSVISPDPICPGRLLAPDPPIANRNVHCGTKQASGAAFKLSGFS